MGDADAWERPFGARSVDGGVEFRVWAPGPDAVAVRLGRDDVPMDQSGSGVWETRVSAGPGDDYWFVLNGEALPDPSSRHQPEGLRGPSRVVNALPPIPLAHPPSLGALVTYELHVGTFSREGTFAAAIPHLAPLVELGIGAIELMPVAEFPGRRGWGYDGVYISAAQSSYGGPEGLLDLVQAAHELGLAVILDVVYNHVGASGVAALSAFGPYFTDSYETPWGQAIDYSLRPVREWVCQSAEQWVRDFGIDGLRLDAIHAIEDPSPEHIVAEVARRVHGVRAGTFVVGEVGLADPRAHGGGACDGVWDDHFHHALHVLLTGEEDGYYRNFGRVEQLGAAFTRRPPRRFVTYGQNHDQVGNRAYGDRLARGLHPLAAFCVLLSPFPALLFMGEEYGETAPFQFFSDHIDPEIAEATRRGRREEFSAFDAFSERELPDPQDPDTFVRSKLTRCEDSELVALYRELLALRAELPAGEAEVIAFDEEERWLRVRRGSFELVCNFAAVPLRLPFAGRRLRLTTAHDAEPDTVAPMSGVLLETLGDA